ncbi:sensor histidine kinase [Chondrinema litorale]|uniref:sensor histidine kinase n=1 Tax=Chondrinema litorale TaxID=2994555 RepID=UPI00254277D3|nr:sensor histidine kinase [Chondrinema litorale]UZR98694.1 sensor histidine kinase [Chondrinema litorale]
MSLKENKYIILHIVGGIIFLILPLLIYPHPPGENNFLSTPPSIRDFITNVLLLVFFYLNFYYLIPQFYFREKFISYGLFIMISFLIIILVPSLVTGFVPWQNPAPVDSFNSLTPPLQSANNFLMIISQHVFLFISVILFSVLLRTRDRLLLTEKAKYKAELTSLKNQINPHFLFNTINSIYAFAIKDKSHKTADSILKLSGLMRYVVSETGNQYVSLEKEIDYIKDYVALQELRIDKKIKFSFKVTGQALGKSIAPLILIPFIENAFKYGVNPDADSLVDIQIKIAEEELQLLVVNNKVRLHIKPYEKTETGIANTKSRLDLLYSSKHVLEITESEKQFKVALTIFF